MPDKPTGFAVPPRTPLAPQRPMTPPLTGQAPTKPPSSAETAQGAYGLKAGARADMLYGATGATKTSRLGDIAEYIFERYGKRSRLISADPGGWEPIAHLVRSEENPRGIIDAFAINAHRKNLYETIEQLTLGYWPQNPYDSQSQLMNPAQNGLREVGGIFIEGATSIAEAFMQVHMTDTQNIQVPRSQAEKENIIKSGSFQHRFASQTDYGSIQQLMAEFVRNSGMLPVIKVVWTAMEGTGEDDLDRPINGPMFIGKALTQHAGKMFGNMLHLDMVNVLVKEKDPLNPQATIDVIQPKPFLFLRNHIRPTEANKRPWPAKTRAPKHLHADVPNVMAPDMKAFYELMDKLSAKARQEASAK